MEKCKLNVFKKIPQLETERLILRRITKRDLDDVYDYASKNDVTRYLLWCAHPNKEFTKLYLSRVDRAYRKGDFYDWGVVLKENGKLVGTCGFTSFDLENDGAEIGYVLNSEYRGKGFMPEALAAVLRFGFVELSLERIEGQFMPENAASRSVMEKNYMQFEGVRRKAVRCKGVYHDVGVCSITSQEFYATYKG